ncbi:MAG: transcription antitermination factor NusB [Deltaproteobacteria bacterium]|nr:transcription antitermination factor NusB [Deltaproteobacteria bacterium]
MAAARDLALKVLARVDREGAYAAAALSAELGKAQSPREAALATEIVLGVLRRRPWLDRLLESASKQGLARIDPSVRDVLRIGAYQIAFMDRIPARAAVSEAVGQVRRGRSPGLSGLANAVLRRLAATESARLRPGEDDDGAATAELAARLGQQEWLFDRMIASLGRDRAVAACRAFNRPSRRTLRVNPHRAARDDLLARPGDGARPGALSFLALDVDSRERAIELEERGLAAQQDEGAQLVALAVEPGPNDRILDACAGRGGKTALLAALAGPQAELWAADVSPGKLERLSFELVRQGLAARTMALDLTRDAARLPGPFHKVLVDAPCSGTGTLGRRPEIRWRLKPSQVDDLVRLQASLLDAAAGLVAPGGRLVYAVCSILREEGAGQLDPFLSRHHGFRPLPALPHAWPREVPFENGCALLDPAAHGTDGYQIVCLGLG